jgi:hypothetical protein
MARSAPAADIPVSLRAAARAAARKRLDHVRMRWLTTSGILALSLLHVACTQEQQNKWKRDIQNWTGTNGVLEIYAGDKLVKRFLKIDKLSTAYGTNDREVRPYRYGYGILDENQNGVPDSGEKRVYFEFSDYSTNYVFFESPH